MKNIMKNPLQILPTLALAGASIVALASSASAAVLVQYDFTNEATGANGANVALNNAQIAAQLEFQPDLVDAAITTTSLSLGSGFNTLTYIADQTNPNRDSFQIAEGNGLADGQDDDIEGAFTANEFVQISVAAMGSTFDLTSFTFDVTRGGNGAQDYAFRASTDNGATFGATFGFADQAISGVGNTSGAPDFTPTAGINQSVDLSAFTGVDNFTLQIAFDDRVTNNGGGSATVLDSFVLNGEVVPEPSSATLLGLGLAGVLLRRRRA